MAFSIQSSKAPTPVPKKFDGNTPIQVVSIDDSIPESIDDLAEMEASSHQSLEDEENNETAETLPVSPIPPPSAITKDQLSSPDIESQSSLLNIKENNVESIEPATDPVIEPFDQENSVDLGIEKPLSSLSISNTPKRSTNGISNQQAQDNYDDQADSVAGKTSITSIYKQK